MEAWNQYRGAGVVLEFGINSTSEQRPVSFPRLTWVIFNINIQKWLIIARLRAWPTQPVYNICLPVWGSLTSPPMPHQRAKWDYFWMFAQNFLFYWGPRKLLMSFVAKACSQTKSLLHNFVQKWRKEKRSDQLQFACFFPTWLAALSTLFKKNCFSSSICIFEHISADVSPQVRAKNDQ